MYINIWNRLHGRFVLRNLRAMHVMNIERDAEGKKERWNKEEGGNISQTFVFIIFIWRLNSWNFSRKLLHFFFQCLHICFVDFVFFFTSLHLCVHLYMNSRNVACNPILQMFILSECVSSMNALVILQPTFLTLFFIQISCSPTWTSFIRFINVSKWAESPIG